MIVPFKCVMAATCGGIFWEGFIATGDPDRPARQIHTDEKRDVHPPCPECGEPANFDEPTFWSRRSSMPAGRWK